MAKRLKKYDSGDYYRNTPQGQKEASYSKTGTDVASAIGPWWGALAKVGTTVSDNTRGDGTNYNKNLQANTLDPFAWTKNNENAEDWFKSITRPWGSPDKAQRQTRQAQFQRTMFNNADLEKQRSRSAAELSIYPTYGVDGNFAKGGRFRKNWRMHPSEYPTNWAYGGQLPQPTEGDGLEGLASDTAKFKGPKHYQGGIPADTDGDGNPNIEVEGEEVVHDNKILSDQLSPSQETMGIVASSGIKVEDNDTYASIAERISRKKGKFEKNIDTHDSIRKRTTDTMISRLDGLMDALFQDQQSQNGNGIQQDDNAMAMAKGGWIQKAVNPKHKGYCTPMTKSTCTPHRKALAMTFKKHHGFHALGGYAENQYGDGGIVEELPLEGMIGQTDKLIKAGKGMDWLENNSGNIAAGVGTLANEQAINQMETNVPARQVAIPRFNYQNWDSYGLNQNNKNYRSSQLGLSHYGNLGATAQASMFAKKLEADNSVTNQQTSDYQRSIDSYINRITGIEGTNAQLGQQADFYNNLRKNEKIGLQVQNQNNFLHSIMGNKAQKDYGQLERDKAVIGASAEGNRGIVDRMIEKNPDVYKRSYPELYNSYIKRKRDSDNKKGIVNTDNWFGD